MDNTQRTPLEQKKIYIGGLNNRFSEVGLRNMLQKFGTIVYFHFNGNYAIAGYPNGCSAEKAIYELNKDTQLNVRADYAHERKIDTSKISGGRPFDMFENPVEPSVGVSYIKPIEDANAKDAICFYCKQLTYGQCKSCLTSFCNIACMRNAAELHASFCQKFGYRESLKETEPVPVLQSGNFNAPRALTTRETWCQSKKDNLEGSRFKTFVPAPYSNTLNFQSRFKTNNKTSRFHNNTPQNISKAVENRSDRSDVSSSSSKNGNRKSGGRKTFTNYKGQGSDYSNNSNVNNNFKSPAQERIKQNLKGRLENQNGFESKELKGETQIEADLERLALNKRTSNGNKAGSPAADKLKSSEEDRGVKNWTPKEPADNIRVFNEKLNLEEQIVIKFPSDPISVTFLYEDMGGFWVLPEHHRKNYDNVNNVLAASRMEDMPNLEPSLNALGAAKYDGVWYRVKVTNVAPTIQIHFIDYGNTEMCNKGDLKKLPSGLGEIDPLVFHVIFDKKPKDNLLEKDARVRFVDQKGTSKIVQLDIPNLAVTKPIVSISSTNTNSSPEKVPNKKLDKSDEERFPLNCKVHISFITPTMDVSLIRIDESHEYEILLNDLDIACGKAEPMRTIPKLNSLVAARYKDDECFYRARVIEVNDDKVSVVFIDYGNGDNVTLAELRSLPLQLAYKPPGAITVKLSGVPATSINRLKENVNVQTEYQLVYKDKITNGVELISNGSSLNKSLLSDDYDLCEVEDPGVFEPSTFSVYPLKQGVQELILLYDGDIDPDGILYCTINDNRTSVALNTLGSDLSYYCNKLEMKAYRPHPNEICAAKYVSEGEESWARAVVFGDIGESRSSVFFVDFGNLAEVDHALIRRLSLEFQNLPNLANKCVIKGYGSADEAKQKLIKEKLRTYFKAEVKKSDEIYELIIPEIHQILIGK